MRRNVTSLLIATLIVLASCSSSSTGEDQNKPDGSKPAVKINTRTFSIGTEEKITIPAEIQAEALIKTVNIKASSGKANLYNIKGIGTKKGSVKIKYTAPSQKGTYSLTVIVTDKNSKKGKKVIDISADPSITALHELQNILENVPNASGSKFGVHDSEGHTMDTAKIIEDSEGEYIAVYHTLIGGNFKVFVATSLDLFTWNMEHKLGNHASQPYIKKGSAGGFFVAWEKDPNNHVQILYYKNQDKLLNGEPTKSYETKQTLSRCAEGTPNIISATQKRVEVGMHYYKNCDVDRQAKGVLKNFTTWSASVNNKLNNSVINNTAINRGKIGDRDQITFMGYKFIMLEAQLTLNDFGSWRCFLYNKETNITHRLHIKTAGEIKNFANPSFTKLKINGKDAIVVSIYIPSDNAGNGKPGQLIYYKYLNSL